MHFDLKRWFFLFISFALLAGACGKQYSGVAPVVVADGKYDRAFPTTEDQEVLDDILASVKMINVAAFYERYRFDRDESIQVADITEDLLKDREKTLSQEVSVGTATIVMQHRRKLAVLTCGHVVTFPDTIISYWYDQHIGLSPFVHQVMIKTNQQNTIPEIVGGDDMEVIAIDNDLDVALLGKEMNDLPTFPIPVFDHTVGKAKELDWGSFLYIVGFPGGRKMLTTGIVSQPKRNAEDQFLIDALFNRGFSGGLVLGVRDGVPNYEMVGIVNAVAADNETMLIPPKDFEAPAFGHEIPYDDQPYVTTRRRISYGITFGISIEAIEDFFEANRKSIEDAGFDLSRFFK